MRLQPLEYKLGHGLALAPAGLEECLQPFLVTLGHARFVRRSLAEHKIQRGNRTRRRVELLTGHFTAERREEFLTQVALWRKYVFDVRPLLHQRAA